MCYNKLTFEDDESIKKLGGERFEKVILFSNDRNQLYYNNEFLYLFLVFH